ATGAKLNLSDAILCISTILNVETLDFKAQRQADHLVQLDWTISADAYPNRFQVQRLFHNGPGFETIASVERADLQFEFEYLDRELHLGKLYYRLQWEDQDGQVYYSAIKVIEALKGDQFIHVYPNPSTGNVNLQLNGLKRSTNFQVEVIDPLGQILYSKAYQINPGNVLNLSFDQLAAGYYQLRLTQNQEHFSLPLMLLPR
ncbi:MAG: T9SS type A sorting domain-containing protein, partial [Bacteroidota bacterium]